MKILISTFGVRGDVQPYLALAVGLQAAGHRVTLATSQSFTAWIESYGVHAHPTSFNFQEAMQRPEAQAIVQGKNFPRQLRLLREAMNQSPAAQEIAWGAIQEADLVVQSPTGVGALEAASQRVSRLPLPRLYLSRLRERFPRSTWRRCASRWAATTTCSPTSWRSA